MTTRPFTIRSSEVEVRPCFQRLEQLLLRSSGRQPFPPEGVGGRYDGDATTVRQELLSWLTFDNDCCPGDREAVQAIGIKYHYGSGRAIQPMVNQAHVVTGSEFRQQTTIDRSYRNRNSLFSQWTIAIVKTVMTGSEKSKAISITVMIGKDNAINRE